MPDHLNHSRRNFLGAAAAATFAASFGAASPADAAIRKGAKAGGAAIAPGAHTSLGPLKQIDAGLLNVGYAEAGPADGPAVILLHGWPYDIHSYADVMPALAAKGYRVIVPHLRGYGTTRFLAADAVRNGQPSAMAEDVVALMDALKIEKAVLAGYDWGARTANIVAALHESGIAAPSTTTLDGRLAIRAAIANHRTDMRDVDALLSAVLEFGVRETAMMASEG